MSMSDARLAASLAEQAGALVLELRDRSGFTGRDLGRRSDTDSNVLLLQRLAAEHPGDAVLSEESVDSPAPALRRPRLDHRPARQHPRIWHAAAHQLGHPSGVVGARQGPHRRGGRCVGRHRNTGLCEADAENVHQHVRRPCRYGRARNRDSYVARQQVSAARHCVLRDTGQRRLVEQRGGYPLPVQVRVAPLRHQRPHALEPNLQLGFLGVAELQVWLKRVWALVPEWGDAHLRPHALEPNLQLGFLGAADRAVHLQRHPRGQLRGVGGRRLGRRRVPRGRKVKLKAKNRTENKIRLTFGSAPYQRTIRER